MTNAVIAATGLFTPDQSISNAELVAAYNAWAERWNAANAVAIAVANREWVGTNALFGPSVDAFVARAWWPLAPARTGGWRSLEPRLKAALPALGVVVELYFHPGDLWFRAPMDATGARFEPDNLNNCAQLQAWRALRRHDARLLACSFTCAGQHAAMYSAFAFSGLCDLLLPPAASRVLGFASLAQAFSVELLLFWCAATQPWTPLRRAR